MKDDERQKETPTERRPIVVKEVTDMHRHCRRRFSVFAVLLVLAAALQVLALYMPDPRRSSYEVPDILQLPDRIAVDMRFRPLDTATESEVYPTLLKMFRDRAATNALSTATPPDAFTRSLGIKPGDALYWRIPFPSEERWVAVEYEKDRPVALYADLDRDGELDGGGEKVVPLDTTTHFKVPPFRRKREGWADFDITLSLDATHQPGRQVDPTVCWYSLHQFSGGYTRRMAESAAPAWTMRDGVPDDPFCRAVDVGTLTPVYSKVRVKDQEQWSVVACRDGIAQALYFDMDADGKPAEPEVHRHDWHEVRFDVPVFTSASAEGGRHPYRLTVYAKGRAVPAWCPAGVWEGPIKLGDKTYRLILFDTNLSGSFSDLDKDCYTFFSEKGPICVLQEVWGIGTSYHIPTHALKRPTQISGVNIFNMDPLQISGDNPTTGTVVLTRDTTAWGSARISLVEKADTVFTEGKLNVGKSDRRDIHFLLDLASTDPHLMPAWDYSIRHSRFSFKGKDGDTWSSDCRGGTFTIAPAGTFAMELGRVALHVRSKNFPDNKEVWTVTRGGEVALTREITGKLGEVYTRFKNATQKQYVCSTLRILDPAGKEAVTHSLGYG